CILELSGKINPKKMPSGLRLLNSEGKTVWSLFDIKNGKYKNASSFYERINVKKGSYSLKGASIKNFSFSNAGGELHVKEDENGNFTQYFLIPGKKNNRSSIFLIPADSSSAPKAPKVPRAPVAPADVSRAPVAPIDVSRAPDAQTATPANPATPAIPAAPAPPADPDNVTEAEKLKLKKLEKQLKKKELRMRKLEAKEKKELEKQEAKLIAKEKHLIELKVKEHKKMEKEGKAQKIRMEKQETKLKAKEKLLKEQEKKEHKRMKKGLKAQQIQLEKQEAKLKAHEMELRMEEKKLKKESKFLDNIVNELQKDGLLKRSKKIHFSISPNSLKINGKKQPASLFKKYKGLISNFKGKNWNGKDEFHIQK
ncbi:MAG: hypothetical protein GY757_13895, partial [bacterium]|nr:hypothetical protein [bacterium]